MSRARKASVAGLIVAIFAIANAGIIGSGFTHGRILAIGSVTVNGVKFDTSTASVSLDGQPGTLDDLRVGQVIDLRGSFNDDETTGTAEAVVFNDNVEGPITNIDPSNGGLTVLGQSVVINEDTIFGSAIAGGSLQGLQPGDVIEVSGLVDADEEIVASRIDLKLLGAAFNVNGKVTALDEAAIRFKINALSVDFSAAMLLNFPGGAVRDGDMVEVTGNTFNAMGEFMATIVEFQPGPLGGAPGDLAEVEGFITNFSSPSSFEVEGQAIATTPETVIENGAISDLSPNVDVEVEGTLDGAGTIVADRIDIRIGNNISIAASAQNIDAEARILMVLGIAIRVDGATLLEDKSPAHLEPFDLSDIAIGDFLEIRAQERSPGNVVAARVERKKKDDDIELQGFVEFVSASIVRVLGVNIVTDANTQFEDLNDRPISAADFFSAVRPGSLVKAIGTLEAAGIAAHELEFELAATGREAP